MNPILRTNLECYARSTTRQLRAAINAPIESSKADENLSKLLNGVPSASINKILGRRPRRADGIYFSGESWSNLLATHVPVDSATRIFDPACGIGDLIVAAARRLPLGGSINQTLTCWSNILSGTDLHGSFTDIAWNRLRALAIQRHGVDRTHGVERGLKHRSFSVGNALHHDWGLTTGDCVLMNPPFNYMPSPSWAKYCSGKVTAALPFLEKALIGTAAGVTVVAIVPEVIRSGSRFERFRAWLREHCDVLCFEPKGSFGGDADIDIALLVARTRAPAVCTDFGTTSNSPIDAVNTLGHSIRVNVGSVVPHRTEEDGPLRPYLTVADATPWCTISPSNFRAFRGREFDPPFVTIHRTSSPSDRERIRATVVLGQRPVLVENHLLVLTPHEATEARCQALMMMLQQPRVSVWLNQRIRCRHLTVSAVAQIPCG